MNLGRHLGPPSAGVEIRGSAPTGRGGRVNALAALKRTTPEIVSLSPAAKRDLKLAIAQSRFRAGGFLDRRRSG